MEDQAIEREGERDEALREITSLRDQLREAERNKSTCDRINSEVHSLVCMLCHIFN